MSVPLIRPAVNRLEQQRRRLALASDARAGSWTRGQVRRRWWNFARDSWRLLAVMTATAAALVCLATLAAPNAFLRGVAVGGGIVATAALLMLFVVQVTGTAVLSAGAAAEQLTASELRPLLKSGWRLINHAGLGYGDIDHILIGPAGVIVIETKWSATAWQIPHPSAFLQAAIAQVQRNTTQVRHWQPVRRAGIDQVWSTVFLWAGVDREAPAKPTRPQRHGDSQIVHGRAAAASWRKALTSAPQRLTTEQIDRLWSDLEAHLRSRDAHETAAKPAPPDMRTAYRIVCASVLAFATASLISLYAYTLTRSWMAWTIATTAEIAVGTLSMMRWRVPRAIPGSWLTGSLMIATVAAIGWCL